MTIIGYHASHEQFSPSALLDHVVQAERAGFGAAMCSDHFHPWSERQGQSGFAWSWLGAALQATDLRFGVVNAPGQRYHPPVIAQAAATLAEMFPDRFWLAVGSGQDLNEHITGDKWPPKADRNERLVEAVRVMRDLWDGKTVTHRGHFRVDEAKLYTRPRTPVRVVAAAISAETARWAAGWAEGLITVDRPVEELREVVEAFRDGGGAGKPIAIQLQLSYAPTDEEARAAAHDQWRNNLFDSPVLATLRMPSEFDAAGEFVRPEELDSIRISSDTARHLEWLHGLVELGVDEIYLHNVHGDQRRFIDDFGARVLTELEG